MMAEEALFNKQINDPNFLKDLDDYVFNNNDPVYDPSSDIDIFDPNLFASPVASPQVKAKPDTNDISYEEAKSIQRAIEKSKKTKSIEDQLKDNPFGEGSSRTRKRSPIKEESSDEEYEGKGKNPTKKNKK